MNNFITNLNVFLLLLLTRAFLSKDIRAVIEGSNFASNIYGYFSLKNLQMYPSFFNQFEFELVNLSLKPFGINYGSTLANIYPILAFTLFMIVLTFSIFIIKLIFSKCIENERWSWMIKAIFWIADRLYKILTFGFFIRNTLELSQFILIFVIFSKYWNKLIFLIKIKLIFKCMKSTHKYVPGSENRLQMIEDCDEEDKNIFQEISDSQEQKNNNINYRI